MTIATIKSDSQIQKDVLDELKWDTNVSETEVGVQVKDGIVTLTGNVSSYPKKLAARAAAHRVHGVQDVVDNTTVKVASIWERTDQELANVVRHTLEWDMLVPDDRIQTTVSNGEVTLEGTVGSWTQRYDVERAVERLTGVRAVINRIAVTPPPVDPMRIKREIEDALERQAEREAKRINVGVHDGVVTLSGSVRSWGEKNAIERAAAHARGVKRLDDRTVVDSYQ